ncbi:MAG: PIG-L family deacetylase [Elusimicrobia bacterium]|nr:PIG-L family deacetylase [Elusimicrobiota bacterium]
MNNGNQLASKYRGKTVLAVGAHPDDLEIGIGGTLARLAQEGVKVVMVVVCVPSSLEARLTEARQASAILGCELRLLFAEKCRRVEDLKTYELVGLLDRLVQEHQPAAMVSHALNNFHRDHALVYNACLATQRMSFHDFFCYYPTSCHPVHVPFFPQAFVDISTTIEAKMSAIAAHASQFSCRGLATDHYRMAAREYGRLAGVEYAEGLEVVRMMLT